MVYAYTYAQQREIFGYLDSDSALVGGDCVTWSPFSLSFLKTFFSLQKYKVGIPSLML